jgi:hypothetical protein
MSIAKFNEMIGVCFLTSNRQHGRFGHRNKVKVSRATMAGKDSRLGRRWGQPLLADPVARTTRRGVKSMSITRNQINQGVILKMGGYDAAGVCLEACRRYPSKG